MSKTQELLTQERLQRLHDAEVTGKLTRKEAVFTRYLIEHPKSPAIHAVMAAYNGSNDGKPTIKSASTIVTANLAKPRILAILNDAATEAEGVITSVMRTADRNSTRDDSKVGAAWASVGRAAANDILDRVHGKATQRTESVSTVLSINMDLSSEI